MDPTSGSIYEANNLTILNFLLLWLGPMTEKRLVKVLMCVQVSRSDPVFCDDIAFVMT